MYLGSKDETPDLEKMNKAVEAGIENSYRLEIFVRNIYTTNDGSFHIFVKNQDPQISLKAKILWTVFSVFMAATLVVGSIYCYKTV